MKQSRLGTAPLSLLEELAKIKSGDVVLLQRGPSGSASGGLLLSEHVVLPTLIRDLLSIVADPPC